MPLDITNYVFEGHVDKNHHLIIDEELPIEPGSVKVVVYPQKNVEINSKEERLNSFRGALKNLKTDGVEFQKALRPQV
jgi:hypothetical protein